MAGMIAVRGQGFSMTTGSDASGFFLVIFWGSNDRRSVLLSQRYMLHIRRGRSLRRTQMSAAVVFRLGVVLRLDFLSPVCSSIDLSLVCVL